MTGMGLIVAGGLIALGLIVAADNIGAAIREFTLLPGQAMSKRDGGPAWDMDDPLEAAIWQICDDLQCDGWVLEDDPHTIPPPDAMFPSTLRHHLRPLMQDWKRYRINALRAELARLEEER